MSIDDVVISPFTALDLPNVRVLHHKLLPLDYPHSFFLQLLTVPNRICLIAHIPSEPSSPIGFISAAMALHPSPSLRSTAIPSLELGKPRLEILTLGVLPAYQHLGLARLLVAHVLNHFPNVTIVHANVSTSNLPAIRFYERIGMTVSPLVIKNLYTTLSTGSRDAYLVVGLSSTLNHLQAVQDYHKQL